VKIGIVILAGGKSSRMGKDKAMLKINNASFIQILADKMSGFDERFIARGPNPTAELPNWKIIDDIYSSRGPLGGIHAAMSHSSSDALLCLSCDTPLISRDMVNKLIAAVTQENDAAAFRTCDGQVHPLCAVYRTSLLPFIERQLLNGRNRMMPLIFEHKSHIIDLDEADSIKLKNINTPEEYRDLLSSI